MNKNTKAIIFMVALFLMGFMAGQEGSPLRIRDIQKAQKLIGLDFEKSKIDTMLAYLERNRKGYDSMRQYSSNLDYDLVPPLYFDPLPEGFQIDQAPKKITWDLPENVALPDSNALAFMTVPQLASLLKSQKITSYDLTKYYIDRIKEYDKKLLAVISLTEELAYEQARRADKEIQSGNYKGPLHGIPYGIKDLFAVKGYKTTWGAAPYQDQVLDYDATIVKKLEAAGAVLVAKLTSGALARGDVWFGGMTRNPWDLEQGASGSSAGSGAATSAGLVGFSIGTETLGSIISPSTRNGVTGLRPTFGRVSRFGGMPLSWTMDKPGPICRSTMGCAIVFDVIRGADPKDRTTRDASFSYQPDIDLKELKFGFLEELFANDTSDNGVNNEKTLDIFREMGITLKSYRLPEEVPYDAFDIILRAEAGTFFDELVREKGVDQMVQQHQRSRANSLRQSRFIPAVEYLQANRHRAVLMEKMHTIMQEVDILISPTFGFRQLLTTNLTGHPAMALPNGLDEKGRPTSITLVANLFDEATLLAVAQRFQQETDFEEKHPPGF